METPYQVERLRIVGGNIALDFLNTQTGPPGGQAEEDALHDYSDVVAWARYAGILGDAEASRLAQRGRARPRDARDTYKRTMRLRRRLYALFGAIARGQEPPRRSVAALQSAAADALVHAGLVPGDNGFSWTWTDDDLARPLWPIAHTAVELLTSGPLERVKGCAGCRFLFLDESKNRSRRWCSMEDCGTADKMRKYVARRAAGRRQRQDANPAAGTGRIGG